MADRTIDKKQLFFQDIDLTGNRLLNPSSIISEDTIEVSSDTNVALKSNTQVSLELGQNDKVTLKKDSNDNPVLETEFASIKTTSDNININDIISVTKTDLTVNSDNVSVTGSSSVHIEGGNEDLLISYDGNDSLITANKSLSKDYSATQKFVVNDSEGHEALSITWDSASKSLLFTQIVE